MSDDVNEADWRFVVWQTGQLEVFLTEEEAEDDMATTATRGLKGEMYDCFYSAVHDMVSRLGLRRDMRIRDVCSDRVTVAAKAGGGLEVRCELLPATRLFEVSVRRQQPDRIVFSYPEVQDFALRTAMLSALSVSNALSDERDESEHAAMRAALKLVRYVICEYQSGDMNATGAARLRDQLLLLKPILDKTLE